MRSLLRSQHTIPAAVAVGCVALATAGGGYSPELRAGVTAAVWLAVIGGVASGVWPRARVPGRAVVAGGALLALALLTGLSATWSPDDGAVFAEVVRVAGYLGLFVLVVVAAPAGSARLWLNGLALGLLAVAALALASRVAPTWFPEQDLSRLIPSVRTRLSYPINYWNGVGAMMAISAVLLAWLGGAARTRAARALAVAAVPVPALAMFLTSSRGGVLAAAAGLSALLAFAPARARILAGVLLGLAGAMLAIVYANGQDVFMEARAQDAGATAAGRAVVGVTLLAAVVVGAVRFAVDAALSRLVVPRRLAVASLAVVAVAAVAAVAAANPAQRLDEFNDTGADPSPPEGFVVRHLTSAEGHGRYQFWEAGLDAFASEPLHGIGAGRYEAWWAREGSLAYYIRDAHSLFVEVRAELGILGLIALLAFLAAAAWGGVAVRRVDARSGPALAAGAALAVLVCGVVSAAIDWTWELPAAFAPLVVAAAVLAGPAVAAPVAGGRDRTWLGAVVLAVAWLAIVAAAIAWLTEAKLGDSRDAARRGELQGALADASEAEAVQPWSAAPRLQIALVRERLGDLPGARRAAREATDRDPEEARIWLVATRLALRDGDVAAARRALARARILNPRSPLLDRRAGSSPVP